MTSLKEFLVTENAKIIGRLDLGEDFEDVMAECASFTDYLTEKYCRTDEFLDRLDKVFPKPLTIWELGTQYEDYMLDRNPGPELTPREEENCRRLVDYVVHIPGNRVLTVIRGVNTITSDQYSIIDVEGEENEKGLRKELTRLFTNLARRGDASLILRYSSPSPGVDIINGFRFKAHFIQKVPQAELKWAMETQPDGSRMEFPDQIYQQAFVSFT